MALTVINAATAVLITQNTESISHAYQCWVGKQVAFSCTANIWLVTQTPPTLSYLEAITMQLDQPQNQDFPTEVKLRLLVHGNRQS